MKLRLTFLMTLLSLTILSQEVWVEAETGKLSNGLIVSDSIRGFSGTGYVAIFGNNDDSLIINVPVRSPGVYDVLIGYSSPGGTKIIQLDVSGIRATLEITKENGGFRETRFATLRLNEGLHPVTITPNWRYFNIDYVRLIKNEKQGTDFNVGYQPVNKAANQPARKLYSFLRSNFLHKCISGVMTLKPLSAETNEMPYLLKNTGKEPALLGLDFMDHTGNQGVNNPDLVKDAITWHNRNGIVAICWHWRDPLKTTNAFYTKNTHFDVTKVNDQESAEYKAMIRDIDIVAGYLKELQEAGVPVLWRPLHEAAGAWFWWGAKGPDACIKLWQVMYDRLTNHHKLNNLIWVWTTTDDSKALAWYPGDECVDILGMDIYPGEYQHGSQVIAFNRVKEIFGGKKMITLSECGSIPHPDKMQNDGASWSWFMPWYGTHTKDDKHNSVEDWKKILESDFVITLDEMPE